MDTKRQNQAKTTAIQHQQVQSSWFQSRPFGNPEQKTKEAVSPSQQPADLPALSREGASPKGYNFSRVKVIGEAPTSVQSKISARTEETPYFSVADTSIESSKIKAPRVTNSRVAPESG